MYPVIPIVMLLFKGLQKMLCLTLVFSPDVRINIFSDFLISFGRLISKSSGGSTSHPPSLMYCGNLIYNTMPLFPKLLIKKVRLHISYIVVKTK